jgi:hypothetical protein
VENESKLPETGWRIRDNKSTVLLPPEQHLGERKHVVQKVVVLRHELMQPVFIFTLYDPAENRLHVVQWDAQDLKNFGEAANLAVNRARAMS